MILKIEWDTEYFSEDEDEIAEQEASIAALPALLEIPDLQVSDLEDDYISEGLASAISDEYGWCILGLETVTEGTVENVKVLDIKKNLQALRESA